MEAEKVFYYNTALNENFVENEEIAVERDLSIHHRINEKGEKFFHLVNNDIEILCKLDDIKIEFEEGRALVKIIKLPEGLIEKLKERNI